MSTMTFEQALAKVGVKVPEHLIADAEVPVLTGPQAQGDLMVVPVASIPVKTDPVPVEGIQVVFGEATGTHITCIRVSIRRVWSSRESTTGC